MNFTSLGQALCGEEQPWFLGVFDFSIAPPLLYYSYVPILVAVLLVGFFVFSNNRKSIQSRLLFGVSIAFALWVINILVQWVASYHVVLMYSWQLTAIIEVTLYLLITYFAYTFFFKRDLPTLGKVIGAIPILLVAFLTPTTLNILNYDVYNCQGNNGVLWNFIYALEPFLIAFTVCLGLVAQFKEKNSSFRRQIWLLTAGLAIFETVFFISNYYGELTKIYEFNFWGPLGMAVFIILIGYIIVEFKAFDIKLVGAQALVVATIILVASQFFFVTNLISYWLVSGTLLLTIIFGFMLVRSVRREVEQRERIELLAKNLEQANQQQIILIHFITHQIKGFMTKSRNIFSLFLDGDYGPIPENLRPMIEEGFRSDTKGVNTIQEILNAANIKSGKVIYNMSDVDLKAIVEEVSTDLRAIAEGKGLTFNLELGDKPVMVKGDRLQLLNALKNLIDNSIKYTLSGSVTVKLVQEAGKIHFVVEDTGVGITKEDMHRLFTEGGHGTNSQKVNVESTGFGLYIVKNIIEAHHGKVWAESEGEGKGSRFIAELPV